MIDQNLGFIFPIQWARGFGEDYSFRTEILTSMRGNEQRIAQRINPRLVYDFESFLRHDDLRAVDRFYSENQGRQFYIPHPQNQTTLASSATAGDSIVNLTVRPTWMQDDVFFFIEEGGVRELVQHSSGAGTAITITSILGHDFGAGARILRAVYGRIDKEAEFRAATSRVGLTALSFSADPVAARHEAYATVPQTLNGREYLTLGNNWSGDVQVKFLQPVEDLDLGRGAVDRLFPTPFTIRSTTLRFILRTDDHVNQVLGLFYRQKGRQKGFYVNSRIDEVRPVGDALAASNTFTVEGREFYDQFAASTVYKWLRIHTIYEDSTFAVSSIALDGSLNSVVTLGGSLSNAASGSAIKSIQWVTQNRFETDRMSLEWLTDGVAETTLSLRTLEDS